MIAYNKKLHGRCNKSAKIGHKSTNPKWLEKKIKEGSRKVVVKMRKVLRSFLINGSALVQHDILKKIAGDFMEV